ncbi:hypothetical protein LGM57_10835 [Burkholderia cepacia]|uniref:hypothetical protein n=1 Tax=Burkholderia cepacia TaxID=292 RepID=UPI001CF2D721|nr:hypothetical protein [Burkholderia cepacia]MCA7976815.1 hypothetical protein [Burkholderia cepacia]
MTTATQLVPLGKAQWTDGDGNPLVGGNVYFYVPGTTTPKNTWQDQGGTTPNLNPVPLNARGEAVVWGTGTYRQMVYDVNGNLVYDVVTDTPASEAALSNITGVGGAALIGFDGTTLDQVLKLRLNRVVDSIAAIRSLPTVIYQRAHATGYYKPHDGGGGDYQVDWSDTTTPDNGGTVLVSTDGTGARWKLQLTGPVSAKQFGAYGDGVAGTNNVGGTGTGHDDTIALQSWLSALSATLAGYWPAGAYNTSSTLTKVASSVSIETDGATNSLVNWIGAAGATDLATFGDGTTTCSFWSVGGIGFESAVKMTGGAALHVRKFMVNNKFEAVSCGMVSNNGNLYQGMWCDLVNVFYLPNIDATKCQGDGLRLNGSATDDSGSDLFLSRGNISFCSAGVHQGGGFGGLRTGQINSFNNGYNYLIDTTIVARKNREVFLEAGSVCDGATIAGVVFDDALTSNAPVFVDLFLGSSGQLGQTGPCHGLWVKNWPNGRFTVSSGQIFNHKGDGVHVDDVSIVMSFASEVQIFNNGGWGVNASARWYGCYYYNGYTALNVLGDFHPNTGCANGTTYVPTVTATSGALGAYTSTMRWSTTGKTATWTLFVSITNIGTASGPLSIQLPFQVRLSVAVTGVDAQNNLSLHGYLSSNTTIEFVTKYDGSFAAVNGSVLVFSGNCEIL